MDESYLTGEPFLLSKAPPVAGAISQEIIDVLAILNSLRTAWRPARLYASKGLDGQFPCFPNELKDFFWVIQEGFRYI